MLLTHSLQSTRSAGTGKATDIETTNSKEKDGLVGSRQCPNLPCQGNFHTYTFEGRGRPHADAGAVRWFDDGVLSWQVVSTDVPPDVWARPVHNPGALCASVSYHW